MNQQLISFPPLPQLPIQMLPSYVGTGLVERDLIPRDPRLTPEQAMAKWRSEHTAERAPFRCLFWMEPQGKTGKTAVVRFLYDFDGKRQQIVGKTLNDPDAAKLLIANSRAGSWLTGARWELYADRQCEDLIDMGRYDQWSFLAGIDEGKLESLKTRGIAPTGNWDFDHMFWSTNCNVCGASVSINMHLYNIDSVTCQKCANRPYLSSSIHHYLDGVEGMNDPEMTEYAIRHTLSWMGGVNARFGNVRKNIEDIGGERIEGLWKSTPMARILEPMGDSRFQRLLETNTGLDFSIFKACCDKMQKALSGTEPFREEHKIAIDFVLRTVELLRVRQLTTGDHK